MFCNHVFYFLKPVSYLTAPHGTRYTMTCQMESAELCSCLTVPKVQFREPVYTGEEHDGHITATVYRSGDVRYKSTVRCYSRQGSAQVMSDFDERPNTDGSIITFLPGIAEIVQMHHTFLFFFFFFFVVFFLRAVTALIKSPSPLGVFVTFSFFFPKSAASRRHCRVRKKKNICCCTLPTELSQFIIKYLQTAFKSLEKCVKKNQVSRAIKR